MLKRDSGRDGFNMYQDEYKRWAAADLVDFDLNKELHDIAGDDEAIKVKVGDKVLHDKYAGTSVKVDGEDYLILAASDILAIVE